MQRLGAGLRIDLTHVDEGQRQAFRADGAGTCFGPGQTHRAEAQFEMCGPFGPLCPRRQHDGALVHHRHGFAGRIQAGVVRELAIMHAAGDHMEALLGRAGIKGKDVALAVAQRGHHGGVGKQRLGRQRRGDPALRFLVRQVARSCETVRRPLRVHTSPLTRPRQMPFSASTASIGCSSTPWPLPLPISPSPRGVRPWLRS